MAPRKRTAAEVAHKAHRPRVGDQVDAELEEAAPRRDPWAGSELRTLSGWRHAASAPGSRNLSPAAQRKVFQRSDRYYETNPTYTHCVNLKTQSIVGDGFRLEAEHEQVAQVLQEFWDQGGDSLDLRLGEMVQADVRYGEVFLPVTITADGLLRLGDLDPFMVKGVAASRLNRRELEGVLVDGGSGNPDIALPVIRRDPSRRASAEDPLGSWIIGEALPTGHVGVVPFLSNRLLGGTRGRPHFLSAFDAFDRGKEILDVALERAKILNHLVWDVLIKGDPNSDEYKTAESEVRAAGAPGPLSLLIHNERVTWTPHAPQIADAGGFDLLHRVNRQQISDGTGFPPHRLNDGNTVNAQATAAEMKDGETRLMTYWQSMWVARVEFLADLQLFLAKQAGRLSKVTAKDLAYTVQFDPIEDNDRAAELEALEKVTTILDLAVSGKRLTIDEARDIWRGEGRQFGWSIPKAIPTNIDAPTDAERSAELARKTRERANELLAAGKSGEAPAAKPDVVSGGEPAKVAA